MPVAELHVETVHCRCITSATNIHLRRPQTVHLPVIPYLQSISFHVNQYLFFASYDREDGAGSRSAGDYWSFSLRNASRQAKLYRLNINL